MEEKVSSIQRKMKVLRKAELEFSNLDSYGDDQTMKINALRRSHDIKTSEYVTKIAALQGRVDQLEAEKAMTNNSTHNFGISNVANRLSASNSLDDEVLRSLSVKLPRLDRQKLEVHSRT